MKNYIFKSVLQLIPLLLLISLIVFLLVHVSGDPVALMLPENATEADRIALSAALGLDQPVYVQFYRFMSGIVQGDFRNSFRYHQQALPIVLERLPASLELSIASILVAILISFPLGILSALKRNSVWDIVITGFSVLGKAAPNFWVAIMLILIFSVQMSLFPVSGRGGFAHLILPAITLGSGLAAKLTRLIRSNLLEVLSQDYVRTARSKGLSETVVVCKHALRNSLLPVVTVIAMDLSGLLGGSLITETIFAWPGMGQLIIQAVNTKDMAIVQAAVFVISIIVVICNLFADILYRYLDPRIKYN
ncbi:ABC transporter permease subunit [Paenibacillus sp. LMG 31456]|uniref:ABC transporter permease subunit n=1 Tax=Paenibacillus foliorum TaxID=2654974 RepID=A0A972GSQ9_9BACL|nr:ABC transporter permease [Paenibacillus foliorum]NOU96184.1 ABC transporter permease subunit [Paenibacillus foliorum]